MQIEIRVHRGAAEGSDRVDGYRVEAAPTQSVWDCLDFIARTVDPTLTLRDNCFAGDCGECGVLVNGREALGCERTVAESVIDGVVELAPLRNHRALRDLVVDREDHFRRLHGAGARFVAGPALERVADEALVPVRRVTACLHCGLCVSACPTVGDGSEFVGPAALAWAARFELDPRDDDGGVRRRVLDSPAGISGCTSCGACDSVCPVDVAPSAMIELLRAAGDDA